MSDVAYISECQMVSPGTLMVRGWCSIQDRPSVWLTVGGVTSEARLRLPRRDISEKFGLPSDTKVAFRHFFLVDLPERARRGEQLLRVSMEVRSGPTSVETSTLELEIDELRGGAISWSQNELEPVARRPRWKHNLDPDLISVILGVYNGGEFLAEAIESVLNQTDRGIEFIIVDDGSTDESAELITSYAEKDDRIVFIKKGTNEGQGHAFNDGILAARGAYTCFLDADDFWYPDKIEKMRSRFQGASDDVALFQHNLDICKDRTRTKEAFRPGLFSGDYFNFARELKQRIPGPFIPTAGLSVPTRVLRSIFPIPNAFRICADGYITRAAITCGTVDSTDESLGGYRIHGSNNTIDNPEFDQSKYVDNLLVPELNIFYRRNGIGAQLPFGKPVRKRIRLNYVQEHNFESGSVYELKPRPDVGSVASLKNIHAGKRAFIVATGPSLEVSDLEKLKDEITFSCNKITLAFGETDWRPTYYSIIDSMVVETFAPDFDTIPSTMLFPADLQKDYGHLGNAYFIPNRTPKYRNGERVFEFSKDLAENAAGGFTVIYLMMQAAYYMGITELYIIGLDFSFKFDKVSDEKSPKNEAIIVSSGERNHFHKDYRQTGDKWTVPRLDLQRMAFSEAKKVFEENGREIINASRKTALDLFETKSLDSVLEQSDSSSDTSIIALPPVEVHDHIEKAEYRTAFNEAWIEGWTSPPPRHVLLQMPNGRVIGSARPTKASPQRQHLTTLEGGASWRLIGRTDSNPPELIVKYVFDGDHSVSHRVSAKSDEPQKSQSAAIVDLLSRARQNRKSVDQLEQELSQLRALTVSALGTIAGSGGYLSKSENKRHGATFDFLTGGSDRPPNGRQSTSVYVGSSLDNCPEGVHYAISNSNDVASLTRNSYKVDGRIFLTGPIRVPPQVVNAERVNGLDASLQDLLDLPFSLDLAQSADAPLLLGKSNLLCALQVATILGASSHRLIGSIDSNVEADLRFIAQYAPEMDIELQTQ